MSVPFSTGFSRKANLDEAIEEAFGKALERLEGEPALILSYLSYSKYPEPEKVEDALRKVAGGAPFIGVSTAGEYVNDLALNGSVVMALLSNKYFKAAVGSSEGAQSRPRDAGVSAARRALAALESVPSANPLKPPVVALLHSAPGREEDVLRGVREVLGRHVAVVGGSSGDDFKLKAPLGYQVSSDGSGVGRVALVLIASKLDYEVLGGHPCTPTSAFGLATRVSGARNEVLEEIDGEPALSKYASWLGLSEGEVRENILALGLSNPLGVRDPVTGEYFVKHPAMTVGESGIGCFATIPAKHVVHMLRNDRERAVRLGAGLLNGIKGKPVGALLIHCAGLAAYLGNERASFVRKISESLGGAPLAGLAAYGEQWGYEASGTQAVHNNLTMAMLVFTAH